MRYACATLVLMLFAAVAAVWGGVRLARHQIVERTPADRARAPKSS